MLVVLLSDPFLILDHFHNEIDSVSRAAQLKITGEMKKWKYSFKDDCDKSSGANGNESA